MYNDKTIFEFINWLKTQKGSSPFGKHNTKKLNEKKRSFNPNKITNRKCIICGNPLHGRQMKYCTNCSTNNISIKIYMFNEFRKFKQKMVDYKGGKCEICGYNKYIGALDFHHKNPKEKDFRLSNSFNRYRTKWEKVIKELDKCMLVCSNCHREIHYNKNI